MVRVFAVLVLLIVSFAAGIYYERLDSDVPDALSGEMALLKHEAEALSEKNSRLNETLQLVKRQIQTDRIAYQSLQEIVESSEQDREVLRSQLESQQVLLQKLRTKLEQGENQ